MRILVTGATGFIGARLLRRLAMDGHDLKILRRPTSSTDSIKDIKYEEVLGCVTIPSDVDRAVEGCEVVFHVAAVVSYWDELNKLQYDVNVNGVRNIVEACIKYKVRRLVHTSSIVAIGAPKDVELASEKNTYNLWPLNINYCNTKHLGELEVQKGVRRGLDAVIVNPAAVFGPGDVRRFRGELYGGTVWKSLFYVGGGISTVDVDDVVEGHILAMQKGKTGERYILANENLTFREISKIISEVMGRPTPKIRIPSFLVFLFAHLATIYTTFTRSKPIATIPMAMFTKVHFFFSNKKAKSELGMHFRPFRESIERTLAWLETKK